MPAFVQKYSDEAKEAMYQASIARGLSYPRIAELARAGELTRSNGEKIPPFGIHVMYLGEIVRKEHRRRTGRAATDLAKLPPRDGIEALRRRLLSVADHMSDDLAKQAKRDVSKADPERLRQIARAVRELAALPGPTDPRPAAPGQKVDGHRDGGNANPNGKTMRDRLIADARRSNGSADAQTAPEAPTQPRDAAEEHTTAEQPAARTTSTEQPAEAQPGSRIIMRAMPS